MVDVDLSRWSTLGDIWWLTLVDDEHWADHCLIVDIIVKWQMTMILMLVDDWWEIIGEKLKLIMNFESLFQKFSFECGKKDMLINF